MIATLLATPYVSPPIPNKLLPINTRPKLPKNFIFVPRKNKIYPSEITIIVNIVVLE